jgi:hypothetical protein
MRVLAVRTVCRQCRHDESASITGPTRCSVEGSSLVPTRDTDQVSCFPSDPPAGFCRWLAEILPASMSWGVSGVFWPEDSVAIGSPFQSTSNPALRRAAAARSWSLPARSASQTPLAFEAVRDPKARTLGTPTSPPDRLHDVHGAALPLRRLLADGHPFGRARRACDRQVRWRATTQVPRARGRGASWGVFFTPKRGRWFDVV